MEKETVQENAQKTETKFNHIQNQPKKVEKNLEKMIEKTKKKRKIKLTVIITIITIIVLAIVVSTIFALLNMNKTTIVSGVKIEGIEMSGLSKEQAKGKLETIYQEKLEKEIPVQYQDYETTINATLLETTYKIDEAVEQALKIGRNSNIFVNNYEILGALLGKTNINVEMELNEEIARKTIEDIGTNLPGVMIDSAYYIEEGKLTITKGQKGVKINTDLMLDKIKENLSNIEIKDEYIKGIVFDNEI